MICEANGEVVIVEMKGLEARIEGGKVRDDMVLKVDDDITNQKSLSWGGASHIRQVR